MEDQDSPDWRSGEPGLPARQFDRNGLESGFTLDPDGFVSHRQDEVVRRVRAHSFGEFREFRSQPTEPGPICFYVDADGGAPVPIPVRHGEDSSLAVDLVELVRSPSRDSLPRPETVPKAPGCLYVLDGLTLGGKVIAGHLKRVLPVDERRGRSIFDSYGNDVVRMRSSFLGILGRHRERHGDADVVVPSACQIFASLDRWLADAA